MAQWDSSVFHNINNLNNGNKFAVTDYPTTDGFNYPIENTQYLHDNCVGVYAQSFTLAQKQQAKTNMGIGSGFDGSYDSLTGKPNLTTPQFQTIDVNGEATISGYDNELRITCYDLQISEDFDDEEASVYSLRDTSIRAINALNRNSSGGTRNISLTNSNGLFTIIASSSELATSIFRFDGFNLTYNYTEYGSQSKEYNIIDIIQKSDKISNSNMSISNNEVIISEPGLYAITVTTYQDSNNNFWSDTIMLSIYDLSINIAKKIEYLSSSLTINYYGTNYSTTNLRGHIVASPNTHTILNCKKIFSY